MGTRNNRRVGRGFDDDDWMPETDELESDRQKENLKEQRRAAKRKADAYLEDLDRPIRD